jgi:hypothetical protein
MVVQMRHLRSYSIVSFLILILIGQTCGVFGQTIPIANHVVINEANINPSGDDTKYPIDWVELYNPTNNPLNIGGWTIGATTGLKYIYIIPANTMIQSKQFLVYTYGPLWFPHAGAVIQLKSSDGKVIDQTPPLTDFESSANSWQRIYDGYDTNSTSDWVFKLGTPGSSNGQPPTTTTISPTTMTLSIDKSSYIFGYTVMMSGKVSKLAVDPVLGYPLSVNLVVSGPSGFQKTFTLYPSTNLQFSTSMKTDEILGFSEGNYTISGSYGTATASASFVLSSTAFVPPPQTAPITMSISTDKSTYTTLSTITLSGLVSQVIPFTPVSYKVYDPNGTMIYRGNLFPNSQGRFSTYNPYQEHASTSGVFINTITPSYGIYNIVASYGTVTATTSFALVPQVTQSTTLTLSTDKQAYAPGDTVIISGQSNLKGLQNLGLAPSLQIIQTFQTSSSGTSQIGNRGIVPNTLSVRAFIHVASDGTFSYLLHLPASSYSLGNYRAIITTAMGSAEADFVVVTNPSTYQATPSSPLSIATDKTLYALGDNIVISGLVLNPLSQTTSGGTSVNILVTNSSSGASILSAQNPKANLFTATNTAPAPLTYYAYPDSNGAYQITQPIQRGVYQPGNYTLKATYNSIQASVSFSVYDPLSTGSQGPIVANTDKQLYGIGETVHLTGKISALTGVSSSNTITLIKPTGDLITSALAVNNGFFSWDWTIPTSAAPTFSSITGGYRGSVTSASTTQNLFGIYSLVIHSDFGSKQIFFQVLQNPQSQSQISPIVVETDKPEYSTTDVMSISGQVLPQANAAAQEQNTQAQLLIYSGTGQEVYRNFPNVNAGGQFHLSVPLHPVIWPTGTYKIYTQYLTTSTQTTFHVTDSFTTGNYTKQVFITTDRDKYLPGQTILVTGRLSSIMAIPVTYLTFGGLANDTIISEGQVVSQQGHTLHRATATLDQYSSFSYDYTIPKGTPLGNYTVVAEVPFGFFNAYYQVVNQLPPENVPTQGNVKQAIPTNATQSIPTNATQAPVEPTIIPTSIGPAQKTVSSIMMIDKHGMLTGSAIPITISEKILGNYTYYPREIDGLLRVNPSDVIDVTIKLSLKDGTCIIGSDSTCKVSQSTIQSGFMYQIVKLGNENFLIGFSGSGQRLQQFSVIPVNANDVIPDGQWNVEIIKKDQISRFYYQITYISK